jgi:hypothetical protein
VNVPIEETSDQKPRKEINHRFHRLGNGFDFWVGGSLHAGGGFVLAYPIVKGLLTAEFFAD